VNIGVIGTGYVGLVTGACLSEVHRVTCFDKDAEKIKALNAGRVPFYEERLEDVIDSNRHIGHLSFSTEAAKQLENMDVIFICVGTPQGKKGCDISQVEAVAHMIKACAISPKVVVVKSTVPPGTGLKIQAILGDRHFYVSNPEFLREGSAVNDFFHAERIVIGTESEAALQVMRDVYKCFNGKRLEFDVVTAEMSKYVCNCALATKISFINEMSNICERVGANIDCVRKVMAADARIGKAFYKQGPGFGGSCFPKDVSALFELSVDLGYPAMLLSEVLKVNSFQKNQLLGKLVKHLVLKDSRVAVWGAAFKAGTDDVRESPAIRLIEGLLSCKAQVAVHDPKALGNLREIFGDKIQYFPGDRYDMLRGADALVIVTDWPEYKYSNLQLITPKIIIDGRGCIDKYDAEEFGKTYEGFGV